MDPQTPDSLLEQPFQIRELELSGMFTCTAAPVQAEGLLSGKLFYFRSRHEDWRFAVANGTEPDPVAVDEPSQGFIRTGHVEGGQYSASFISLEEATAIIRRCAEEFLKSGSA